MKYIITENKLNNVIFKYLDMKYGAIEQEKGKYSDIVFTFPGEEYGVIGWKKSGNILYGNLYVSDKLEKDILNYFELKKVDSLPVIAKWIEDRYDLKDELRNFVPDDINLLKIDIQEQNIKRIIDKNIKEAKQSSKNWADEFSFAERVIDWTMEDLLEMYSDKIDDKMFDDIQNNIKQKYTKYINSKY
jgi:hypothetical protein